MISFRPLAALAGVLLLVPASDVSAGYDFGPLGLRTAARYIGIGPGPGYHGVPCGRRLDRFQSRVTDHYAPYPLEPDYRPNLFHEQEPWLSPSAPDTIVSTPFLPDGAVAHPLAGTGDSIRLVPAERPPVEMAPAPKLPASLSRPSDTPVHRPLTGHGDDGEPLFHRLRPPEPSEPNASGPPATAARFGSNWW